MLLRPRSPDSNSERGSVLAAPVRNTSGMMPFMDIRTKRLSMEKLRSITCCGIALTNSTMRRSLHRSMASRPNLEARRSWLTAHLWIMGVKSHWYRARRSGPSRSGGLTWSNWSITSARRTRCAKSGWTHGGIRVLDPGDRSPWGRKNPLRRALRSLQMPFAGRCRRRSVPIGSPVALRWICSSWRSPPHDLALRSVR